jgi:hypothetical protein
MDAGKKIRFIANFKREQAVVYAGCHSDGFVDRLVDSSSAEIESPNQPPTRGAKKGSKVVQPAAIDNRRLGR